MEMKEASARYGRATGYKQTEVGVIPEDWQLVSFGALVTEFRGGAPFRPSDFTNSGVKVLPKGAVGRTGWLHVDEADLQYCSVEYATAHPRNQVDETFTIVVLRDLVPSGPSIGLMVQIRNSETFVLAQGVYGFKVNSSAIPGYLVQLSNTRWYRKLANSIMVGSTQVHITNTALKRAQLPLPPPAEQETIAEALSDADALIESLEQLLAKKRHLKQGAMQQLLTGKKRLPGFSGEWRKHQLGDVLSHCSSGATPYRGILDFYKGTVKWITSGELNYNVITDTIEHISEEAVQKTNLKVHPAGTFLMAITGLEAAGTRGACGIVGSPATTNQSCMAIYPSPELTTAFLYHYYVLRGNELAFRYCQGTKQQSYTAKLVRLLPIDLPPTLEEQTAIATILSDMDAELAALEEKLAKARHLKQGMMQQLLTGRIRLILQPDSNATSSSVKKEAARPSTKLHNWQIDEAVIIGVLTKHFGSEDWPLARKRCTKLTYLFRRHSDGRAEGYLKKAAGPYNPATRYKGPESIARKNGYVRAHHNGKYEGYVAASKISEAASYFEKWYGSEPIVWLERFRRMKTDELELLATVDMAMEELRQELKPVELEAVKSLIGSHPEWEAKLEREIFSDANIARAIATCRELFA